MVKIMIICLNSSQIHYTNRCINSIKNLRKVKDIDYDIWCNVNTLNENYYKEVLKEYNNDDKVKIIRTKSNGRPGRGHNSCFELFKKHNEYDYMLMIDGDDLYYPTALEQFSKYIKCKSDVVHLLINDKIGLINQNNKKTRYKDLLYNLKLFSCFNQHDNWLIKSNPKSYQENKLNDCKTPTRIIMVSRNIFNMDKMIYYGEDMKLYDDFLPFLDLVESQNKKEGLNIHMISDSNIYLYNAINDNSVSKKFTVIHQEIEDKTFRNYLKSYKTLKSWKESINCLDYINVSLPDYTLEEKYKFCIKYIINFEINILLKNNSYDKLYNLGYYSIDIFEKYIQFLNDEFKNTKNINSLQKIYDVCKTYMKYYPNQQSFGKNLYYISQIVPNKSLGEYYNNLSNKLYKIQLNSPIPRLNINTYNKKIIGYYTGYSPAFNGRNYGNRNVWGSEIAAIKLMEEIADKNKNLYPIIFCNCDEEIKVNGIQYLHFNSLKSIKNDIEHMIVSRFIDFFIKFDIKKIKNIHYLLHDFIPHGLLENKKMLEDKGKSMFYNFLPKINNIIYVSDFQLKKSIEYFKYDNIPKSKIKIIPNGININTKLNFDKKIKNSFMYYSDPTRGLEKTCEIIVKLNNLYPNKNIHLNIYFSYIPENIKINYVNKYNYIKFHGKKSNNEIKRLLSKNHFWLYPNINNDETFCIAALEAMNYGNTIITLKNSGVDSTVSDNCGIFINKDENITNNIINNIKDYLDKPKNKLSENAFKRSLEYDWSNIYKLWNDKIFKIC